MRLFILLASLLIAAHSACATRPITVEELRQTLVSEFAANKSDTDIAKHLSAVSLTERLTGVGKARIKAETQPGPKTAQALDLLADSSALLAPPPAEIPTDPKPDIAAQRAVINAAINYVATTLRHLPDFLATRATNSFDDMPTAISHSGYEALTPMHADGTFTRQITYRDGREVIDSSAAASGAKKKLVPGPQGLATWGEFGPVLAIALTDAAKGRVTWSRWEQSANGRVAVFHYEVPKAASHYLIDYCCSWASNVDPTQVRYHDTPGYHGDLYVDPVNGSILRVTLEAELTLGDPVVSAGIAVEYGPVNIDGKIYMCPVHSIAISTEHNPGVKTIGGEAMVNRINEVAFMGYHKFGSTARILAAVPDGAAPSSATPAASPADSAETAASQPSPAFTDLAATSVPAVPPAASPAPTDHSEAVPADAVAANATPPIEAEQEAVLRDMPVYRTNAREVVVDVVVTKGNGEPVHGLTREDFEAKEDGKPQTIDFFEEHSEKVLPPTVQQPLPAMPPHTYTNVPPAPESDSVNVILFDKLNTPLRDQAYLHNQMDEFFRKMQPGTRVAIFVLGSSLRFVQGFTSDTSLLLAALNGKKNGVTPQKDAASRDRGDTADDAADVSRLRMMQASEYGIAALQQAQDFMAEQSAGKRAAMTFEALDFLAQYLAGVPGRKNLLWFSSSFPVLIFPTAAQRDDVLKQPQMSGYLDRVKETADMLTVSKVAVYPIHAEGIMEEHVLEANSAGPGTSEGVARSSAQVDQAGTIAPYNLGAGEHAATMSAMEQLAADTGGKAYFNTNDLGGAAQHAMNDGANYYTLAYSPTNAKMDGQYRRIEMHLAHGRYKLSYRRGYNADEAPSAESQPTNDPLRPLLKFGLPNATGLLYGVRVLPENPQPAADATRAGRNPDLKPPFTRYSIDFFIRWTDVALIETSQGAHAGRIEVGLMAFDRDGNAVNWEGGSQVMNIDADLFRSIQKSGLPAHMEIDLPDKDVFLITGVYDLSTGKAGTIQIPLHPAATSNASAMTGTSSAKSN
jgi:VWFA-related protein